MMWSFMSVSHPYCPVSVFSSTESVKYLEWVKMFQIQFSLVWVFKLRRLYTVLLRTRCQKQKVLQTSVSKCVSLIETVFPSHTEGVFHPVGSWCQKLSWLNNVHTSNVRLQDHALLFGCFMFVAVGFAKLFLRFFGVEENWGNKKRQIRNKILHLEKQVHAFSFF